METDGTDATDELYERDVPATVNLPVADPQQCRCACSIAGLHGEESCPTPAPQAQSRRADDDRPGLSRAGNARARITPR